MHFFSLNFYPSLTPSSLVIIGHSLKSMSLYLFCKYVYALLLYMLNITDSMYFSDSTHYDSL